MTVNPLSFVLSGADPAEATALAAFLNIGWLRVCADLDVEAADAFAGAGVGDVFAIWILLLDALKGAVGIVEAAEALFTDAHVIEDEGFILRIIRQCVGGIEFSQGCRVVVLIEGDVAELGVEMAGDGWGGIVGEAIGVGLAGEGEIADGIGGGGFGAVFDGVAAEVIGFGEVGGIAGGDDFVGVADGGVVLLGLEWICLAASSWCWDWGSAPQAASKTRNPKPE